MVNIWKYVNANRLSITTVDGTVYIGLLVCVMDTDENGREEDDITIQLNDGRIIGFLPSEIKNILEIK